MPPNFVETTPGIYDLIGSGPGHMVRFTDPAGTVQIPGTLQAATLTMTVAGSITIPSNTASAWNVQDALGNSYWVTDTRTTTSGVTAHTIGNPSVTIAAASGASFRQITNAPFTLIYTGTNVTVSANNGVSAAFQIPTISGAASITVTTASTVSIQGPPTATTLTITNSYALDVLAGNVHFAGKLGLGLNAATTEVFTLSGATSGGTGQHGILGTFTTDGQLTANEWVHMKLALTSAGTFAGTVARMGGVNIGAMAIPATSTVTKLVCYSWDGGAIGTGGTINTCYGVDIGSLGGGGSVTVTDPGAGGAFIGYRLGVWAVTGSGTVAEFYGVRVIAPTLTTISQAFGMQIGIITGSTVANTVKDFAIQTLGGAAQFTVSATVHASGGGTWDGFAIPASTLTMTSGADSTQTNPGLSLATIYQPTISSPVAFNVAQGSSFVVQGAPLQAGAGPASVTTARVVTLATTGTTISNVTASNYDVIGVNAHTLTLSAATNMTNTPAVTALRVNTLTIAQTGGAVSLTNVDGLYVQGIVTGASVTVTTHIGVHVDNPAAQSGALTNDVGMKVEALTRGGTGNTALWVQNPIQVGNATINTTANQIHTATQGAATTQLFIGNASINVTSDVRLKTGISPTQRNALELFRELRVVDYTWNDPADQAEVNRNSRGRWTGMLAQEMVDIVPWIINAPDRTCPACRAGRPCDKHPTNWFVEYEHLVPLCVKGFQEVDTELERLRQRVRVLEATHGAH